jgi:hypothetical protein
MEYVFDVSGEGSVSGLHFDSFDLGFLGKKEISRASEILFNVETQLWDVAVPGQKAACPAARSFASYEKARAFEVDWLQECRKFGFAPQSLVGEKLASVVRRERHL